ncbi:MAG: class D sortase [Bryobacteraceae bacterium]|jgi:sortase A
MRLTCRSPLLYLARFLLIAGSLALSFTAWTYGARYAWQTYESWRFDRSLATQRGHAELLPPPAALQSVIGRIEIPRLGISAILKEGVGRRTLNLAAGHIPSTALPGQPGNVGVAAHRDNLFRGLKDVKRDDAITLTTLDNTYIYRVVSFKVVDPTDVSVLDASADEKTLTLVTCYPFYFVGNAPRRFIVRAIQVEQLALVQP